MIFLKTLACRKLVSPRPKTKGCVLINLCGLCFIFLLRICEPGSFRMHWNGNYLGFCPKRLQKQTKPAGFGKQIYNFSTQAIEIGIRGPDVQGHLQLFVRLKVNLGH